MEEHHANYSDAETMKPKIFDDGKSKELNDSHQFNVRKDKEDEYLEVV